MEATNLGDLEMISRFVGVDGEPLILLDELLDEFPLDPPSFVQADAGVWLTQRIRWYCYRGCRNHRQVEEFVEHVVLAKIRWKDCPTKN